MAKEGRLHLRVDKDLVSRMHDYARRNRTDVTQLVTDYFLALLRAEEAPLVPEVEQV
jgi:hypothetical protein